MPKPAVQVEDLTNTALPSSIHRSRVYDGEAVPHDCPRCGRMATDPHPPRLVDGLYIDCVCGPSTLEVNDERTAAQRLASDVRDLFREASDQGKGNGSSGGSRGSARKPKAKYRVERRPEQEAMAFGARVKEKVAVKRVEPGTEPMGLQLSPEIAEALRREANCRTLLAGEPVSMVSVICEALPRLHQLTPETPRIERTDERTTITVKFSRNEKLLLAVAADVLGRTMSELVETVLTSMLESWLPRAQESSDNNESEA